MVMVAGAYSMKSITHLQLQVGGAISTMMSGQTAG